MPGARWPGARRRDPTRGTRRAPGPRGSASATGARVARGARRGVRAGRPDRARSRSGAAPRRAARGPAGLALEHHPGGGPVEREVELERPPRRPAPARPVAPNAMTSTIRPALRAGAERRRRLVSGPSASTRHAPGPAIRNRAASPAERRQRDRAAGPRPPGRVPVAAKPGERAVVLGRAASGVLPKMAASAATGSPLRRSAASAKPSSTSPVDAEGVVGVDEERDQGPGGGRQGSSFWRRTFWAGSYTECWTQAGTSKIELRVRHRVGARLRRSWVARIRGSSRPGPRLRASHAGRTSLMHEAVHHEGERLGAVPSRAAQPRAAEEAARPRRAPAAPAPGGGRSRGRAGGQDGGRHVEVHAADTPRSRGRGRRGRPAPGRP